MKRVTIGLCLALAACAGEPRLHEDAVDKVHAGMTPAEVQEVLGGRSYREYSYANGTASWTYKYRDANIAKLLHVTFGPDRRVLRTETEWDPEVYSKKGRGSR
jgi:hypothetical protein